MIGLNIKFVHNLQAKLEEYKRELGQRFQRSIVPTAIVLHRASGKVVPIETGNMWNTSYVRSEGSGFQTIAIVAFTAPYSPYVHEDMSKAHGADYNAKHAGDQTKIPSPVAPAGLLRRPEETPKFLEGPLHDVVVQAEMRKVLEVGLMMQGVTTFIAGPNTAAPMFIPFEYSP